MSPGAIIHVQRAPARCRERQRSPLPAPGALRRTRKPSASLLAHPPCRRFLILKGIFNYSEGMATLRDARVGQTVRVTGIRAGLEAAEHRRLGELGFSEG